MSIEYCYSSSIVTYDFVFCWFDSDYVKLSYTPINSSKLLPDCQLLYTVDFSCDVTMMNDRLLVKWRCQRCHR